MAHELTLNTITNQYEFAFTGDRAQIWHGLGQQLPEDATIEEWQVAAGMNWNVFESLISYQTATGQEYYPGQKALFRSDNQAPLAIVGSGFKIVQPPEVLEFFRELVELHGMKINAAGTVFGGKRFWATAECNKSFDVNGNNDEVYGQLLLATSVDGMMSTTAKFVSTRVVCNNTLTVALNEGSKQLVRKTHHTEFDAKQVKLDLGLIDKGWEQFKENITKLANFKMGEKEVREFYQDTFYDQTKSAADQGIGAIRVVNNLMDLYKFGKGAEKSIGTAWGALNGATELFTHVKTDKRRSTEKQKWETNFGTLDKQKTTVMNKLLALAA